MRHKRRIILFTCAFLISFLLATIIINFSSVDLASQEQQIKEPDTYSYKTSKHTLGKNVDEDLQEKPNLKASKKIIFQTDKELSPAEFPIGWYVSMGNTNTLTKVASENINIVMPYVGESSESKIMTYLDAAEKAGVKVLLELPRSMVKSEDTYKIIQFVRRFKHHPAVFAWYSADEPEIQKISPQALENTYKAIKAEDSNKPVAVVFTRLWGIEKYLDALDIFIWDHYPVTHGSPEFGGTDWKKLRSWFKKAASYAEGKKGFWFVMQGYGEKYDGTPQFGKRLPTYDEERYMLYSAVLSGIDGLFFWAHYRSQQSWIDSVLTPIVNEFYDYIPAITAEKITNQINVNRSDIQAVLYQDYVSKTYYMIAINHGNHKLNAILRFNLKTSNRLAKVSEQNRYVELLNNDSKIILKDSFEPYAVNIYKVS